MALFRIECKRISRSGGIAGQSSVAKAAYRHGASMEDPRTGQTWDFRGRHGVNHAEVILPKGAPAWMRDPHELWSSVELHEKRKDAYLAQEWILSLPRELDTNEKILAGRDFGQWLADRGIVADMSFHDLYGRGRDQAGNPHLHIMGSTREATADGWGDKVRAWDKRDMIIQAREAWETIVNGALKASRRPERVTRLSLAARGISRAPMAKVPAAIWHAAHNRKQAWAQAIETSINHRQEARHARSRPPIIRTLEPEQRDWWDGAFGRWARPESVHPWRWGMVDPRGVGRGPDASAHLPGGRPQADPGVGGGRDGLAGPRPIPRWEPVALHRGEPGTPAVDLDHGSGALAGGADHHQHPVGAGGRLADPQQHPAPVMGEGRGPGDPVRGSAAPDEGLTWSLDDELPEPITETPDLDWFGGEIQDLPGSPPPPTRP